MFGLFKKQAPVETHSGEQDHSREETLLLAISSMGWEASLHHEDNNQTTEHWKNDTPILLETGVERIRHIIRDALDHIPKKTVKAVPAIALLVEGGAQIVFSDNKPDELTAASPATARQFGNRLIHAQAVTFGAAEFGPPPDSQSGVTRQGMVYGFGDVRDIRQWLAALETHGTRIVEAVPAEYLILRRAATCKSKTYAAALASAHHTTLIIANHGQASILIRSIPVGLMTLVEAAAIKNAISPQDALDTLTSKDLISSIQLDVHSGGSADMAALLGMDPFAEAMQDSLTRLSQEIRRSLDFFEQQRGGGRPDLLEWFGNPERLKGLLTALANATGMAMTTCSSPLLDLFAQSRPLAFNLLKGADVPLLTIGKTRFHFGDKGFVTAQARQEQLAQEGIAKAVSRRPNRRERRRERSPDSPGLIASLAARFTGKSSAAQSLEEEIATSQSDQDKQRLLVMLGAMVLLAGWFVMDIYGTKNKQLISMRSSYSNNAKKAIESKVTMLGAKGSGLARVSEKEIDKVLWSEKFLSLSKHISDSIWLTDLYVENKQHTSGTEQLEGRQLVLKGAVLPSTDGHIARISEFIEALLGDQGSFMNDFGNILFQGAELEGGENVVRFTVVAIYDQTKHVESLKKGTDAKSGSGDMGEMFGNIDKRNQVLNQLSPTGGK